MHLNESSLQFKGDVKLSKGFLILGDVSRSKGEEEHFTCVSIPYQLEAFRRFELVHKIFDLREGAVEISESLECFLQILKRLHGILDALNSIGESLAVLLVGFDGLDDLDDFPYDIEDGPYVLDGGRDDYCHDSEAK